MPNASLYLVQCSVREGGSQSDLVLSAENSAFKIDVQGGTATFSFKHPFSTIEEAEQKVSDFLRSWEADRLFQTGSRHREVQVVSGSGLGVGSWANLYGRVAFAGPIAEANTREQTPWRRHRYWDVPLVASLISRYEDYRAGREKLTVLGYLCLSALEQSLGRRAGVAARLLIDRAVLDQLARLVNTAGTYRSARKGSAALQMRELTPSEQYWIERVILELLDRAGMESMGAPPSGRLRTNDLPSV